MIANDSSLLETMKKALNYLEILRIDIPIVANCTDLSCIIWIFRSSYGVRFHTDSYTDFFYLDYNIHRVFYLYTVIARLKSTRIFYRYIRIFSLLIKKPDFCRPRVGHINLFHLSARTIAQRLEPHLSDLIHTCNASIKNG